MHITPSPSLHSTALTASHTSAAASTSSVASIPDATATPAPPAASTSGTSAGMIPPIATQGRPPARRTQPRESLGAEARAGVFLGRRLTPGADAPVVRSAGGRRLVPPSRPTLRSTKPGGAMFRAR